MNILLTAKPGTGKSTIIEKFILLNKLPASWVVTKEILDPETNNRLGFMAKNSDGKERIISHKTDVQSDAIIGDNYVDIDAVNDMFADILNSTTKDVTIIDEIGPIQLLSKTFSDALSGAFQSSTDLIATIHYNDARLAEYRDDPRNLLLEVTLANRNMLADALVDITKNLSTINAMTAKQQETIRGLLRDYIEKAKLLQVHKLVSNAVHYVAEDKIEKVGGNHWEVKGRHDMHDVTKKADIFACDCDLFNGRGQYIDKAGECSHIQSALIYG